MDLRSRTIVPPDASECSTPLASRSSSWPRSSPSAPSPGPPVSPPPTAASGTAAAAAAPALPPTDAMALAPAPLAAVPAAATDALVGSIAALAAASIAANVVATDQLRLTRLQEYLTVHKKSFDAAPLALRLLKVIDAFGDELGGTEGHRRLRG